MILICMTGNQTVGSLGVLQFLDDIKGMTCNSLPTLRPVSPPEASKAATATRLQVLGDSHLLPLPHHATAFTGAFAGS